MTDKLLCESLEEFRLLKEADEGDGAIKGAAKGIQKAVMTAPGRFVRKKRAKAVMKKYEAAMLNKSDQLMTKYFTAFNTFVTKVNNKVSLINSQAAEDKVKLKQKKELAEDVEVHLRSLIEKMNNGVNKILEVYTKSFGERLSRKGTLTGVEFMPEEKASLESDWKSVEETIVQHVAKKTLELLDNAEMDKLAQIKATLEAEVEQYSNRNINPPNFGGGTTAIVSDIANDPYDPNDTSDKTKLTSPEKDVLDDLDTKFKAKRNNTPIQLDHNYSFKGTSFPDNIKNNKIVRFVIDNTTGKVGYVFYKTVGSTTSREVPEDNNLFYITKANAAATRNHITKIIDELTKP